MAPFCLALTAGGVMVSGIFLENVRPLSTSTEGKRGVPKKVAVSVYGSK